MTVKQRLQKTMTKYNKKVTRKYQNNYRKSRHILSYDKTCEKKLNKRISSKYTLNWSYELEPSKNSI